VCTLKTAGRGRCPCRNSKQRNFRRKGLRTPKRHWICQPVALSKPPASLQIHRTTNVQLSLIPIPRHVPWLLTSSGHYLTINVTVILTGCTLEFELVAVTVIVKVPAGVPGGGGGGGGEPPPQPTQSSTTNAPVAKTQRGMCLLVLSR
jgi:hypothetical protein